MTILKQASRTALSKLHRGFCFSAAHLAHLPEVDTPGPKVLPPQRYVRPFEMTHVEAGLKHFKPITPSLRHTVLVDKSKLWHGRPIKALTRPKKSAFGRSFGQIVAKHRGGGHKKLYRLIDFRREKLDMPAVIQRFEYDPNRTAFIALIKYEDGSLSYIVAPQDVKVGETVISSQTQELDIKPGNSLPLRMIPIGTKVHNVELHPHRGAQYARSAGTYGIVMDKRAKPGYVLVHGPSKEQRFIPQNCMATIGMVSNPMYHLQKLGKAGRNRWLGRRPHVRGVAQSPYDHPMGGGTGRSSGGRPSCSETGVLAKGYKTVRHRRPRPLIFVPRGGPKAKK